MVRSFLAISCHLEDLLLDQRQGSPHQIASKCERGGIHGSQGVVRGVPPRVVIWITVALWDAEVEVNQVDHRDPLLLKWQVIIRHRGGMGVHPCTLTHRFGGLLEDLVEGWVGVLVFVYLDVLAADEVFLTNSSWGVLPVVGLLASVLDGGNPAEQAHPVGEKSVGPASNQLILAYEDLLEQETRGVSV